MRSYQAGLTAVVFFIGMALPFYVSAQALTGFGLRPGQPRVDEPRSESVFIHTVEPGSVINESVRVVNNKNEDKRFVVYAGDSTRSSNGGFACEQMLDTKDKLGKWVDFELTEVNQGDIEEVFPNTFEITVGSKGNITVPFTITVPENAEVGEHNGCILIQEANDEGQDVGGGVSLSLRTGIRMAVTVPGDINREVLFSGFTQQVKGKNLVTLTPVLENIGNVSAEVDLVIKTRGILGRTIAEQGGIFQVLRGEKAEWNFDVVRPIMGAWATSAFSYSYEDIDGLRIKVDGARVKYFMVPSLLGWFFYLLGIIFLIYLIFILRMRRKQQQWIQDSWIGYTIKDGDTLAGLARMSEVNWRIIAKVNNIKAPYNLESGRSLKLPSVS